VIFKFVSAKDTIIIISISRSYAFFLLRIGADNWKMNSKPSHCRSICKSANTSKYMGFSHG